MGMYGDVQRTVADHVDKEIMVCECCGGKNIEERWWVNVNTLQVNEPDDDSPVYCKDCNDEVCIMTLGEFEKQQA